MNQPIKTLQGTALLAVCLLVAVTVIGNVSKQFDADSPSDFFVYVPAHTQMAAVSGTGSGLLAYYTFDEGSGTTAGDSSGSNTGTIAPGATWSGGKVGSGALNFDGSNGKVTIAHNAALDNLGPLSISAWINPRSMGERDEGMILGKYGNGGEFRLEFKFAGGSNALMFARNYDGTPNILRQITANNAITMNTWQHVAVTWDGSGSSANIKIYVNGVETGYQSPLNGGGTMISDTDSDFTIGNQSTLIRAFDGSIDDVRLYNRVLSPQEISDIYGYVGTVPPPAPSPSDTTAPTISMTSPAAGSVSGTVTVSANASDNVAMAGVQFKLDGNNLQSEDTTSPYSVPWDTTTSSSGTHTITAIARDAAGNTTTANSVSVQVSNTYADTIPPVLSQVTSAVTSTSANVAWTTNEITSAQINYGPTASYGNSTSLNSNLLTSHSEVISNLTPNTTYHYKAVSKDAAGNTGVSTDMTIITSQSTIAPPVSVVSGRNLIENSSFEGGLGHGWSLDATSWGVDYPLNSSNLNNTSGYHGNSSLRIKEDGQRVISKIYRLKPGVPYTLSLYAKNDTHVTGSFCIDLTNDYIPVGAPVCSSAEATRFYATSTWGRFSTTFTPVAVSERTGYTVTIRSMYVGYPEYSFLVDAIQLEEGTMATEYKPRSPVEVGLGFDDSRLDHSFFEDEQVTLQLREFNDNLTSESPTVKYEVYDYFNNLVKSGEINKTLSAKSGATTALNLTLSPVRRGAFRVLAWASGYNGTVDEVTYSVLPRPQNLSAELSIFGTDMPFADHFISGMKKTGFKWDRTLSVGNNFGRWNVVESRQCITGTLQCTFTYNWIDGDVDRMVNQGINIMGSLSADMPKVPSWNKDALGDPDLDAWARYVTAMVTHYKGKVHYWEVWNEPDTESILTPAVYAALLKRSYIAIKQADPTATVVGMVATNVDFINSVLTAIGPNYFDIAATHIYPGTDPYMPGRILPVYKPLGKDVWNTETGNRVEPFHQTILWEDNATSGILPTKYNEYAGKGEIVLRNVARTVGNGLSKYIYYDSRNTASTQFLTAYSMFEWDQSLRPKAISFAILAKLFDGSKGLGPVAINQNTESYLFMRGQTPLLMMFNTAENTTTRVTFNLTPGTFRVYDIMGNDISTSGGVLLSDRPIYVESLGIDSTTLVAGIAIANASDTEAPHLSMATWPTGNINTGDTVLFRWFGLDNVTPALTLQYSHKLEGKDSAWSAWSNDFSATYTNLPAGTYPSFSVKVMDSAGNTSTVICSSIVVGGSVPTPTTCSGMSQLGATVVPPPVVTTFSVTKTTSGTGAGTISCSPSSCSNNVGSTVTLVATPSSGSTFTGWGGSCTGTGGCTIDRNATVNAIFTLTVAAPIVGDLNGDKAVNSLDYTLLVSSWNQNNPAYDLNHDGTVNTLDYGIMLQNWTN